MNSGITDLFTLEFTYVLPPTAASTKRRQQAAQAAAASAAVKAAGGGGDAAGAAEKKGGATQQNGTADETSTKSTTAEPSTQPQSVTGSSSDDDDAEGSDQGSSSDVESNAAAGGAEEHSQAKKLAAAKKAAEEEKKQQLLRDGKGLQEMAVHEKLKAEKAQRAEKRLQEIQSMEAKIEKQKDKVRRCQAKLEAAEKQACATTFSDSYFVCQLRFKGEVDSSITGEVYAGSSMPGAGAGSGNFGVPVTPSSTAGTATETAGGGSGTQPSILAELLAASANEVSRKPCGQVLPTSRYYWDPCDNLSTSYLDLSLHIDKMSGSLLGSDHDLTNVILTLSGVKSTGGWCVGSVEARSTDDPEFKVTRANRVRFLLKNASKPRCTCCAYPVPTTVSYGCQCNVAEYCSLECQRKHQPTHHSYCALLKEFSTYRFGRSSVMNYPQGPTACNFQVFWRSLNSHAYTVLVDAQNPLGVPYIIHLSLLKDAVAGMDIEFLGEDSEVQDEVLVEQNKRIFQVLLNDALEEGHLALSCITLNFLYLWCSNPFLLQQCYLQYMASSIGQVAGRETIVVYSLAEFIMLHRPLFELSNLLVEGALKSTMSLAFWSEIELAKQHLSLLCNSISFGPNSQLIRATLGAESQRRALRALAKVYIIIATRLPKGEANRTLQRAQDCYKDAIEEDKVRSDYYNMSVTCLQLAALYRMFSDRDSKDKAQAMQDYAFQLLRSVNHAEKSAHAAIQAVSITSGVPVPEPKPPGSINREQVLRDIATMLQDSDGSTFALPKDTFLNKVDPVTMLDQLDIAILQAPDTSAIKVAGGAQQQPNNAAAEQNVAATVTVDGAAAATAGGKKVHGRDKVIKGTI